MFEMYKSENIEKRRRLELDQIITAAEAESEFCLKPGTVRAYLVRHPELARKAGNTWLMLRSDAQRIWGH